MCENLECSNKHSKTQLSNSVSLNRFLRNSKTPYKGFALRRKDLVPCVFETKPFLHPMGATDRSHGHNQQRQITLFRSLVNCCRPMLQIISMAVLTSKEQNATNKRAYLQSVAQINFEKSAQMQSSVQEVSIQSFVNLSTMFLEFFYEKLLKEATATTSWYLAIFASLFFNLRL